jgi:transcriptional regulator
MPNSGAKRLKWPDVPEPADEGDIQIPYSSITCAAQIYEQYKKSTCKTLYQSR